jgi:hypothetical protein
MQGEKSIPSAFANLYTDFGVYYKGILRIISMQLGDQGVLFLFLKI